MSERDQGQTKTAETSDQRAESTADGMLDGQSEWLDCAACCNYGRPFKPIYSCDALTRKHSEMLPAYPVSQSQCGST